MPDPEEVFECRRCGQCCEGKGGIVISAKDLTRLAAFFDQTEELFVANYTENSNGKLKLRCGDKGTCIFFIAGTGCSIHAARPDICRAWPFFRGNLIDETSFAMAKGYCPGIFLETSFETFVLAGLKYLMENQLISHDKLHGANALNIENLHIRKD